MKAAMMIVVSLLITFTPARAADGPQVRMEVKPDIVIVGAPITMRVTVLAPTWFAHRSCLRR